MHPYIVKHLFGIEWLNIATYGTCIAVGLLACFIVLEYYSRYIGIKKKLRDFLFYDGVFSTIAGFGSAFLFQNLYNYIDDPEHFQWENTVTFIGGLLGGSIIFVIVYLIAKKRLPQRLCDAAPVIPCCITITHAFGRIGCFFAGCCYGKPTDSFLGVKFPHLAEKVHPTQLYESAFLFILFAVLSFLLLKKLFKHTLSVYMIAYGIFRFAIEYLRDDYRGEFVTGLTPSQFWSIAMVVLGIILIPLMNKWGVDLKKTRAERIAEKNAQENGEAEKPADTDEKPVEEAEKASEEASEEVVTEEK